MKCDRCKKDATSLIMSMFNEEMLCEKCKSNERKHPDYKKACDAERAEVLKGNYNFPGIGKPKNL